MELKIDKTSQLFHFLQDNCSECCSHALHNDLDIIKTILLLTKNISHLSKPNQILLLTKNISHLSKPNQIYYRVSYYIIWVF